MRPILRFILLTALRDRLFGALAALLAVVAALALFLGEAVMAEGPQAAVVFGAGLARNVLVVGLLVFIAFHVQRLFDSREIEVLLARPISRERLMLALWAGFATVGALLAATVGVAVAVVAPSLAGALAFAASLLLEVLIVCSLALFCAITLERAVVTFLAGGAIYVFARMGSVLTAIAENRSFRIAEGVTSEPLDWILEGVAALMPRLDLFSQTRWLLYGPADDSGWTVMVLQAAVSLPLLLAATMFDFRRKRF